MSGLAGLGGEVGVSCPVPGEAGGEGGGEAGGEGGGAWDNRKWGREMWRMRDVVCHTAV